MNVRNSNTKLIGFKLTNPHFLLLAHRRIKASMSVFTILERLAPQVEKEVNLILNSKKEAQTLKSKLERINEGLQDAERHGVMDQNVKRWLGELEDVMNEMDDALDQWEAMNAEQKMEQSDFDHLFDRWEKVRSLLLSVCSSFKHVVGRRKLVQEMIALSGKLDKILEERGKYNFVSSNRISSLQLEKQETTSPVDKSKVHGRKYDTDSLVDLLLSENGGVLVVSLVGIGGLGKTTLAQLVYNDARIENHFGRLKAWVSVPNPFDASTVAAAIVGTFDRSMRGESNLEILGQRIKAIASGKNFFLVLDNVWKVERAKWESLNNFFVGETGFKILVTTRDAVSARTMGTTHFPRLEFLSDPDCATILNTIALKETRGEKHEEFREIGFEIAKKCNGLPLAAKTIGHALEIRSTTKEWRDLLQSPLWMYEDEMSDMLRPLRLSYMDLSPLLKRCFLSSVLYSKGFNFDSKGLIRIWAAQGFVDTSGDWDQVLAKGQKYVKSLSDRYLFQVSGRNEDGNLTYKMHDIIYDFATHMSRSDYSIIVDGRTDKRPYRIPSGGRTRYFCARFVSKKDLPLNLLKLLKCARVLCLSDCDFEEFSEDLGKLIHLRYLDLSGNLMEELPATVSNLYNLQTLDLRRCRNLIRLPTGLKKMIKLRHLLISETERLLEYHEELSKLTGLWTLDKCVVVTRDSVLRSNQLEKFIAYRFSKDDVISIGAPEPAFDTCIDRITDHDAVDVGVTTTIHASGYVNVVPCRIEMEDSNDVTCLSLVECFSLYHSRYKSESVEPKESEESLDDEASKYLNNMRTLDINGSQYSYLPQLQNFPMLVTLRIQKMDFQALTLEFFLGGFPKLETLTFSECKLWEEWEDMEEAGEVILPCLNYLAITLCPNLKALPHRLLRAAASLQELFVAGCPLLAAAYDKEMGGDWDQISHIANTIILADY